TRRPLHELGNLVAQRLGDVHDGRGVGRAERGDVLKVLLTDRVEPAGRDSDRVGCGLDLVGDATDEARHPTVAGGLATKARLHPVAGLMCHGDKRGYQLHASRQEPARESVDIGTIEDHDDDPPSGSRSRNPSEPASRVTIWIGNRRAVESVWKCDARMVNVSPTIAGSFGLAVIVTVMPSVTAADVGSESGRDSAPRSTAHVVSPV